MIIKQFEYKPLAHYSYAIISNGEMALIDPERDPKAYYEFAKAHKAKISAVIETHPHADFVSSHLQIHKETGATIYNSEKLGAEYPHKAFDEGISIHLGDITLNAINTPGHSPDSISIVATDGTKTALFTGDTLFIGDVGRPDLREEAGNMKAKREALPDATIVYPAHGAGSLCGKNLSDAASSTLGEERQSNWAFKKQSKDQFMATLLDGQPFIPSYFGFNVDINKKGAESLAAEENAAYIVHRVSKIGYEKQVKEVITLNKEQLIKSTALDLPDFKKNPEKYTIVDIRNESEVAEGKFFKNALVHPLNDLRNTAKNIPTDKPIVVHCAGGYRSAAGSSILERQLKNTPIFDLSEAINNFK